MRREATETPSRSPAWPIRPWSTESPSPRRIANLTTQVGSDVPTAQQNQTETQDLVTQAQQQVQTVSGVDLNAEGPKMLQFQQAYQAVGQMVTVLNSLTQTLMDMVPLVAPHDIHAYPFAQQFLNNLGQINQQMQQAETQLSTGLSVNQASDAPDEISPILQARSDLSTTTQINTDLGQTSTEVNSGEQAMESAVQLFDQIQTLGAEGDTSTATASSNSDLAQQVNSVLQQMVGLANTQVSGRYIFAGDTDQQQPYTVEHDAESPGGEQLPGFGHHARGAEPGWIDLSGGAHGADHFRFQRFGEQCLLRDREPFHRAQQQRHGRGSDGGLRAWPT